MNRLYFSLIKKHLTEYRQMIFLAGPRPVGKTTCCKQIQHDHPDFYYLNWDNTEDRRIIIKGTHHLATHLHLDHMRTTLPVIVLDEIHKYKKWKQFLKGFFDHYEDKCRIVVTGSAKLDVYRRGGDSLMGRYFLYRFHPLSVGELLNTTLRESEMSLPQALPQKEFDNLLTFGGFPEPFMKSNKQFTNNWQRLRKQQLLQEDIRQWSQIQELAELEYLIDILTNEASGQLNIAAITNQINVAQSTLHRWIKLLSAFYYIYTIKPWHKNIRRSLRKTPKVYLWDWSMIDDKGKRIENFIASHLYKAVNYWTDTGLGEYDLFYLRDKEKREVDFLVTKNKSPWFLVETKTSNNKSISKHLYYYYEKLNVPHAFQVVYDMPYVNIDCFKQNGPIVVPAITFLSQLV
jgi:uncharacterized protein